MALSCPVLSNYALLCLLMFLLKNNKRFPTSEAIHKTLIYRNYLAEMRPYLLDQTLLNHNKIFLKICLRGREGRSAHRWLTSDDWGGAEARSGISIFVFHREAVSGPPSLPPGATWAGSHSQELEQGQTRVLHCGLCVSARVLTARLNAHPRASLVGWLS